MSVAAVIPARGGSKGIPRKNLKKINGVTIVERAIIEAQNARNVDVVILSTDDVEIASVGERMGVKVMRRSPALSSDSAPTLPVVIDVVDRLEKSGMKVEVVAILEPTSPFRSSNIIDECIAKCSVPSVESVVTVTQLERNPHYIFSTSGDVATPYIEFPRQDYTQRQQFSNLKRINGCVYASKVSLLRSGRLIGDKLRVVEMSPERSINIDSPLDLEIARLLATKIECW